MKTQTFGIEIEMTGIRRYIAAQTVAEYFGTEPSYVGGPYKAHAVKDREGRTWRVVRDVSITAESGNGSAADEDYQVELVSPICHYNDIEKVQEIVRALRKAGMRVNETTGIHIHIGKDGHTARSLKNIVNIMASKEDILFKALQVNTVRAERWCKKVDTTLLQRLNKTSILTESRVREMWYNGADGAMQHYHESRYHALNLHSVWQKGTIEFRCFNSTTHAGKIKAYIQFCMLVSHQAKIQKSASSRPTKSENEKYTFRTWLLRLGMIGDEFETARLHLLANLNGNIAWRNNQEIAA